MGSSPAAPTVVMNPATPTVTYKNVTPLESYQQTADYLARIQKQTNVAQEQLQAQSGTPSEIGARSAGYKTQEAASYLASLPASDKYTREAAGGFDPYQPARDAAAMRLSDAQKAYATALANINNKPVPAYDLSQPTPSWATSTIPEGMPGYQPPAPAPAPAPAPSPLGSNQPTADDWRRWSATYGGGVG